MGLVVLVIFLCPATLLIGGVLLLARFAKSSKLSHYWVSIPVSLVIVFVVAFFFLVVYNSNGFLRFIFASSLPIVIGLSVIIGIIQGVQHRHVLGRNNLALYFTGIILIAISSSVGRLGSNAIVSQCERSHLANGNVIVNSLENYFRDNQQYPDSLSELVPNYVRKNSIRTCYSLALWQASSSTPQFDGFYYKKCPLGTTQLSIPEMGSRHFHVYDLGNKKWYTSLHDSLEEWDRVTRCQDYE